MSVGVSSLKTPNLDHRLWLKLLELELKGIIARNRIRRLTIAKAKAA